MADMDDYDALPAPIRAWLSRRDDDYMASVILEYWIGFVGTEDQFLAVLEGVG